MAINALDEHTIVRILKLTATYYDTIAELNDLNVLYDADGGLKSRLQQADLDALPALQGIQKQQLDDAAYVLTNGTRTGLNSAREQLAFPANVGKRI